MEVLGNSLIESGEQCWTCPIFDKLFVIVSNTAGAAYQDLTLFAVIIFSVLFAFYIVNAVWQNIKKGAEESLFQKTLKPIVIKSMLALSLLGAGLMVPRIISKITFEPAALITMEYSKTMLPSDYDIPEYTDAIQLEDNSFFNSDLRDTIIKILETSVSNFQVYIKIGIAIMDSAFTFNGPSDFGRLIRHIIILCLGAFLTYNFGKLFVKYSFCFMDVIIAMAMFAFFFPFSVVFFIFKDAQDLPGWMKNLGKDLGGGQIKKLINAIVSMAAAILTYTVIMLIIKGFLAENNIDSNSIQNTTEALLDFNLDNSSAMELTLTGVIVLVYVVNYIADKIPDVTKKIFEAFGVQQEDALSKEMGENMWTLTNLMTDKVKGFTKTVTNLESLKQAATGAATQATQSATTGATGTAPTP